MRTKNTRTKRLIFYCLPAMLLLGACSKEPPKTAGVRIMPVGKQFSGFLTGYDKLKLNPEFENTLSYVRDDPAKNIHKYVAVIIEPVAIYVATDATAKTFPDNGRTALASYFQQALARAVGDAYPVVQQPGPLVLRLRSALIGVDVGGGIAQDQNGSQTPSRVLNIGKVGVEAELVDSETGEQIAAAVDRHNLGEGAEIGSVDFSREEKFREATRALQGWASRLRAFLDSAHELSSDDITRNAENQKPYGRDEK
jgi:uncharacterized protein DUF3313